MLGLRIFVAPPGYPSTVLGIDVDTFQTGKLVTGSTSRNGLLGPGPSSENHGSSRYVGWQMPIPVDDRGQSLSNALSAF